MLEILGYAAIVCVGVLLGCIGSGGSMLAIPILVYLFSKDVEEASAYSLFLVGVTSLTGAMLKQKEQFVAVRAAIMFGVPSIPTTFITRKWLVARLPDQVCAGSFQIGRDDVLLLLFSILMIASSLMMLRVSHEKFPSWRVNSTFLIPAGFIAGLISGLVGVGGGFLILPAMVLLAGLSVRSAIGTTLFIIASNSLLGFCGDVFNHSINWLFLLTITGFALLGLLLGVLADKKMSAPFSISKGFAWFTLLTGVSILAKELVA